MTILKTFTSDLSLPRFQFACKYIFPLSALFLTWGALGNVYTLTLSQKALIANRGEVRMINKQLELGTTQYQQIKYYPIIISLENTSTEFRLRSNFNDWFYRLQEKIQDGDTITVYTRSSFDALLSWGKKGDVYEIDKNDIVLFPLDAVKEYNKNQALALGFFASILWALFIAYKFKSNQYSRFA